MSRIYIYLGIAEAIVVFVASQLALLARFGWTLPAEIAAESAIATGILFAACIATAMTSMGLYQRGAQEHEASFAVRLGLAFLIGTALLSVLFYAIPSLFTGRGVIGLSLIFAFVGVAATREIFGHLVNAESRKRRVMVLGAGVNAKKIADLVTDDGGVGFVVVGYIPLPRTLGMVPEELLLRSDRPLVELAIENCVDEVVVAPDDRRGKLPVDDLVDCKLSGFEVLDLLSFFEKELQVVKIDLLHPSWIFLSPRGFRMGLAMRAAKRALDLAAAATLLALASPVMLLVSAASLVESRGRDPILYRQVRVGLHGNLFRIYKFRSMRVDAEADGVARWASTNDGRITRLGALMRKTRIDELPQLLNVLRGQMSLVGPRPERPEFVQQLSACIPYYGERHRVKPGVTGWAQLLFSYGSDEEDARRKLEYDLYYVKHASLALDLAILLQTVEVVLFGKGAR